MSTDIWSVFEIEENQYYAWQVGTLRLYIHKKKDELSLSSEQTAEDVIPATKIDKPGQSLEWKRWIINEKSKNISFLPIMPDRPLVVKTQDPLSLLPGCKEIFFISIPVWIRVVLDDTHILTALPGTTLSNTWFGDPFEGLLAYAIKSTASTEIAKRRKKGVSAICPLTVNNKSPISFDFVRLCLYTDYLGVFKGEKYLWTNSVNVNIVGVQQITKLDVSSSKPDYEKDAVPLTNPRLIPSKGLTKKIFSDFKIFKI